MCCDLILPAPPLTAHIWGPTPGFFCHLEPSNSTAFGWTIPNLHWWCEREMTQAPNCLGYHLAGAWISNTSPFGKKKQLEAHWTERGNLSAVFWWQACFQLWNTSQEETKSKSLAWHTDTGLKANRWKFNKAIISGNSRSSSKLPDLLHSVEWQMFLTIRCQRQAI